MWDTEFWRSVENILERGLIFGFRVHIVWGKGFFGVFCSRGASSTGDNTLKRGFYGGFRVYTMLGKGFFGVFCCRGASSTGDNTLKHGLRGV